MAKKVEKKNGKRVGMVLLGFSLVAGLLAVGYYTHKEPIDKWLSDTFGGAQSTSQTSDQSSDGTSEEQSSETLVSSVSEESGGLEAHIMELYNDSTTAVIEYTTTPTNYTGPIAVRLQWTAPAAEKGDVAESLTYTINKLTKKVTITCLKPFAYQASIVIYSIDDPNVKAVVTIDYKQRVSFDKNDNATFSHTGGGTFETPLSTATFGVGSIHPSIGYNSAAIYYSNPFKGAVENAFKAIGVQDATFYDTYDIGDTALTTFLNDDGGMNVSFATGETNLCRILGVDSVATGKHYLDELSASVIEDLLLNNTPVYVDYDMIDLSDNSVLTTLSVMVRFNPNDFLAPLTGIANVGGNIVF